MIYNFFKIAELQEIKEKNLTLKKELNLNGALFNFDLTYINDLYYCIFLGYSIPLSNLNYYGVEEANYIFTIDSNSVLIGIKNEG